MLALQLPAVSLSALAHRRLAAVWPQLTNARDSVCSSTCLLQARVYDAVAPCVLGPQPPPTASVLCSRLPEHAAWCKDKPYNSPHAAQTPEHTCSACIGPWWSQGQHKAQSLDCQQACFNPCYMHSCAASCQYWHFIHLQLNAVDIQATFAPSNSQHTGHKQLQCQQVGKCRMGSKQLRMAMTTPPVILTAPIVSALPQLGPDAGQLVNALKVTLTARTVGRLLPAKAKPPRPLPAPHLNRQCFCSHTQPSAAPLPPERSKLRQQCSDQSHRFTSPLKQPQIQLLTLFKRKNVCEEPKSCTPAADG